MKKCIICGEKSSHKYCKKCYKKLKHTQKCIICNNITASKKDKYCEDCKKFRMWASSKVCKKRHMNMDVQFTIEWLAKKAKDTPRCELCGQELTYCAEGEYFNYASLDRINNEKVLNVKNVWIVCYKCNTTKSNRTLKEFINYCKLIVEKWGE